jgi:hypothetical protein
MYNLLTLSVLIPLHLPCTPSIDYGLLSVDYENTFVDYTNVFANCAHNFENCANIPHDGANIAIDSANILDISSLDRCIPNPTLLQLLFIYR